MRKNVCLLSCNNNIMCLCVCVGMCACACANVFVCVNVCVQACGRAVVSVCLRARTGAFMLIHATLSIVSRASKLKDHKIGRSPYF